MTKGYWVVFADIADPAGYKPYQAANTLPIRKYGGRVLARGEATVVEGIGRSRVVVVEFPSYQAARDCYHSPEYTAARTLREGVAVMDFVLMPGYDGPQPMDAE